MTFYVAIGPDGQPVGVYPSMGDAQAAIAHVEPDILEQARYVIHPIDGPRDAEALKLNLIWKLKVEKFDAETGELIETVEREGVN